MDSKQFEELVARLKNATTRRDAVKGVVGGALASVGVTSVVSAKKGKGHKKGKKAKCKGHGKDQVTICHKGRPLTVSRCAFEHGHSKHGDFIITYGEPCPPVP